MARTKGWFDWFGTGESTRSASLPAVPRPQYMVAYRCFCGADVRVAKLRAVEGDNLSSAFGPIPEHADEHEVRCPHSGQQPRYDPRPDEKTKFTAVELDRAKARERLMRLVSRSDGLFGQSSALAPAE